MDYYKTYTECWENIIISKTLEAKDYFRKSKEKNRPFLYAHKAFTKQIIELLNNEIVLPLKEDYPEILSIFNRRAELAENQQISSVLSNEIKDLYLENGYNLSDYYILIEKLAQYEALSEISRNLSNHNHYLELVYKTEMWENFQLKEFEKGYLNDSRYIKMRVIIYPTKEKKIPIVEIKTNPVNYETQRKYQNHINKFTKSEKKFILFVLGEFYKGEESKLFKEKLPFTEVLMSLQVTKDCYDERIFYTIPSSITYYTSINTGIKLAPKGKGNIFLNNLIEKLDSLGFEQLQKLIAEWYITK
tara:strand:+ start:6378 stop:7286 length:909 start_codon:yes stop_codon:yes gene_type:complete